MLVIWDPIRSLIIAEDICQKVVRVPIDGLLIPIIRYGKPRWSRGCTWGVLSLVSPVLIEVHETLATECSKFRYISGFTIGLHMLRGFDSLVVCGVPSVSGSYH